MQNGRRVRGNEKIEGGKGGERSAGEKRERRGEKGRGKEKEKGRRRDSNCLVLKPRIVTGVEDKEKRGLKSQLYSLFSL